MGTEITLLQGDCREVLATLPAESVQCVVTSPPYYGLRDYGVDGQIGLEQSPAEYVAQLVEVFREVRRVLRADGTVWLNLGDSFNAAGRIGHGTRVGYKQGTNRASAEGSDHVRASDAGLKPKDLMMIPARVAIALQDDGWYLRADIIWSKPNPMPESVTDRPTKSHEYVFLLTKAERYFYDAKAIAEPAVGMNEHDLTGGRYAPEGQSPHTGSRAGRANGNAKTFRGGVYTNGKAFDNSTSMERGSTGNVPNETGLRNARSVWTIATTPYAEAHFATFPPALAERCIKAGSKPGDTVLDPFAGAGTTLLVADRLQRSAVGIELNPAYCGLIRKRLAADAPLLTEVA